MFSKIAKKPIRKKEYRIDAHDKFENYAILLVIFIVFMCDLFSVMSYRGLYSDGANFFLMIIRSENFLQFDWHRQFAHLTTQWPVIVAINNHIWNLSKLELIYSASLIIIPDVIWFLSILLLRCYSQWIIILAFAISKFNSGMFSVSEMHISLAVCTLCASLILRDGFSFLRGVALLASGLFLVRSYESCIFLSAALAFMAIYTALTMDDFDIKRMFFTAEFCVLMIAAIVLSVESIMFPRDPVNLARVFNKTAILTNYQWTLGVIVLSSMIVLGMTNRFEALSITCAGFAIFGLAFPSLWSVPAEHYRARLAVALTVFGAVLAAQFLRQATPTKGKRAAIAVVTLLFVLVSAVSDVSHTLAWRRFLHSFSHEVQVINESKSFKETNLIELDYQPSWLFPTMSILFRPKNSNAMITKGYNGWEPFDPEKDVIDIDKFK